MGLKFQRDYSVGKREEKATGLTAAHPGVRHGGTRMAWRGLELERKNKHERSMVHMWEDQVTPSGFFLDHQQLL
jgi:hypothetical protein